MTTGEKDKDGRKKKQSLIKLLMSQFAVFMIFILLLATPIFYYIITNYYAEDLIKVADIAHIPQSELDLEQDTVLGLVFQVFSMCVVLAISIFIIMRLVPQRLWKPFYQTLDIISHFKVEDCKVPAFGETKVREFSQLNTILKQILSQSVNSFKVQKEFTENASHELQTPLAVVQGKLDMLLQNNDVTEEQSVLLQDIYQEIRRMSRLNQNLLLLARIENVQYKMNSYIDIGEKLNAMIPTLETIANGIKINADVHTGFSINCNEVLLESMISNLVVNALRHNISGGIIDISFKDRCLTIANKSSEPALDPNDVFKRFHRNAETQKGNGLGLAIVKSICDYHHWIITYSYTEGKHVFMVNF